MSQPPIPTPIYRIVHIDNLPTILTEGAIHAPRHVASDGRPYVAIHEREVQSSRMVKSVPCGPGGQLLDYVPFYFGPRSPMLYRVTTGWNLPRPTDQRKVIYLVSDAQRIVDAGLTFVFFDGHALANLSVAYDDLRHLDLVDWEAVYARQWGNTPDDPDRQRRKQAEFLVHQATPWDLITEIGVLDQNVREEVERILCGSAGAKQRPHRVRPDWYY